MILDLVSYFYYDNEIFALPQLLRLNRVFDVLTGLFNQVGIRTNTQKTARMACQSFHTPGRMLVEAEERRTMVTGPTF